jgi:hypothetical protein
VERERRDAYQHHLPCTPESRDGKLSEVKAQRGGSVQIEINMVRDVKAPQEGQAV